MTSKKKKLVLIDGNALLYRSFYALPPLKTKQGIPTGGVYGFTRILLKLLQTEKPDYIACAFDKGKKTFRHQEWKEYKITRPTTPSELSQQIPILKQILEGFRIPFFEKEEYEADDILATLAKRGEEAGLEIEIFTGDKDIFQIISPSIKVVRFKKGISQTQVFDVQKVKEEYGVSPQQIADYLALVGDISDNIPGVPGIGPKTATKLIQRFGSVEGILNNLDKLPPRVAEQIKKNDQQIKLSKKLALIVSSVPLEFNLDKLKTRDPDRDTLLSVFQKLEFKELIKKFNDNNAKQNNINVNFSSDIQSVMDKITSPVIIQLESEESNWKIVLSSSDQKDDIFEVNLGEYPEKSSFFKPLKDILTSEKIKKIGHNLKDTIIILKKWGIDLNGVEFDTGIASYLLNSSSSYSLEDLCLEFLGKRINTPIPAPLKVQLIRELYPILRQQLKNQKVEYLFYKVEIPLLKVLAEMQLRGIKVNPKILKDFLQKIRLKREKIEDEIYKEVGETFNINSPQQLGKILFERLNLPVIKRTKTGYSTSEATIQTLSIINPLLKKILDYRHLFKLESSYIKPLLDLINPVTGRIHTCFNQMVTSTGRLSSSNPNLQNIPIREKSGREIRKAFVAGEDHLFISADYSQIELRLLAHLSGDKRLIDAFLKGEDIHRETAAEIFNVLPLQVTAQMRRKAKVVNFGIIYGISPFGLAQNLGISEGEAEEYIERYLNRYPGVKLYIEKTLEEARKKGYVTTIMGRRRYILEINSRNKKRRKLAERIAINSPIQGSAADLIKLAMVNLQRRIKKDNLPGWIILQLHDELLLEVLKDKVDQLRKIVKEEMESAMKLSIPLVVDIKIGKNWGEMGDY